MAQIKVRTQEIETVIGKLQALLNRSYSMSRVPPEVTSGGDTALQTEDILRMILLSRGSFDTLVSNTIGFLQNVEASYIYADRQAQQAFSSSGSGSGGGGGSAF